MCDIDNVPLDDIETAFEGETGASEGCSSLNTPAPPKRETKDKVLGLLFCCGTVDFIGPLTSCNLNPSAVSAEAGHPVTDALSGSIPLISTKKI